MSNKPAILSDVDEAFEALIEFVDQLGKEYNFRPWWASLDGAEQQAEDEILLEGRVTQD